MEVKTLEDVAKINLFGNHDYDCIMEESMRVLKENRDNFLNMDISDTPISPMSMEDNLTPIFFFRRSNDKYR